MLHSCSDIAARLTDPQRSTWDNDTLHCYKENALDRSHAIQGFHCSTEEVPISQAPTKAGETFSLPYADYSHVLSNQTQNLPLIKDSIPISTSQKTDQRVQLAANVPVPISPPSKQAKHSGLRTVGVHDLLNPVKQESDSTKSTILSPRLQQSHELPQHPTPQSIIPNTQSSACHRPPPPGSSMVLPTAIINQPQSVPSSISSSDHTSTMTFGTDVRYPMMTVDIGRDILHVPVDMQTASKEADTKRKRNATASLRFRQRRKQKEHETAQISELERRIQELEGERDYYRDLVIPRPGYYGPCIV